MTTRKQNEHTYYGFVLQEHLSKDKEGVEDAMNVSPKHVIMVSGRLEIALLDRRTFDKAM